MGFLQIEDLKLGLEKYWAKEFQRFVIVELIITECVFRVKKKLLDENRYILPANCYLYRSGKIKAELTQKQEIPVVCFSKVFLAIGHFEKLQVISVVKTTLLRIHIHFELMLA